ncbi:serine protease grass-like [Ochlerotatus camptorhynchus]|uniref:serine protease grass-like n=1 Tax=Ochlerotatus camptorhynchus TaxID=644619 RepID=UPI0031DD211D
MCDRLHDRYLKKHHKISRAFGEFLLKSKCQSSDLGSTSFCCRDPPSPDGLIKHWRAQRLGLDQCGTVPFGGKILEGQEAGLGQYPWMVNLMYYLRKIKTSICSGSLIHPVYVLTSAHCSKRGAKPVSVRLGEYDRSTRIDCEDGVCATPFKEYYVDEWIPHEYYRHGHRTHDIALIRLDRPVPLVPRQIYPICLPLTEQMLMTKPSQLTVTGWGLTEEQTQSNVLQEVSLQVMGTSEYCQHAELICARGRNNEGHCRGDSGGPLQKVMPYNGSFKTVLFGVVSGGSVECSTQDKTPGVSTMVGYHIRWILDHMKYV